MLAQRDSSPGRRPAQFCKPKILNTVAECVQYERGGNDWIVTEVMSPDGRQGLESIREPAVSIQHAAFSTRTVTGTSPCEGRSGRMANAAEQPES